MDRIAGRRLEYLGQQAVGITREHVAQRGRPGFRRLKLSDRQARERPAELDHDAGIGRQMSLADDTADGAFATDENGFDVAAVLAGYQKGRQTRSARKVDGLDVVAGIIQQLAGLRLFLREMWRDQREVFGAEPPQQVVEWPSVQRVFVRNHPSSPVPASSDNNGT